MKTRTLPFLAFLTACGGHAAGEASHGLAPDPVCDSYLACADKTYSDGFEEALAAYGDGSPCWKGTDQAAKACSASCGAAAAELGTCGCASAAECEARATGLCSGSCVAFAGSMACLQEAKGFCWSDTGLTPAKVAENRTECVSEGGTMPERCPKKGVVGVCTVSLKGATETVMFYLQPGFDASLYEQECETSGGTWTDP